MVSSLLLTLVPVAASSILEADIDGLGLLQFHANKHDKHGHHKQGPRTCTAHPNMGATDSWCQSSCNHNPPNCPASMCTCEDAPVEHDVCVSTDPRTTDLWCQQNCNHNPPHCPAGFCTCEPYVEPEPIEICTAVEERVTQEWCDTNCNHNPPFCPIDFCSCENPQPEEPQYCISKHPSHTNEWCNVNCNHNPPFCPQEFCGCQELEQVCTAVKAPATDDWCFTNCNHNPRFCPEEFCSCEEPQQPEPNQDCRSISPQATGDWCFNNCNHNPSFCPEEFCSCEAPTTFNPTTAAPATTTLDDDVEANDDPHMSTIHGNKFDIFKAGDHVLLNIPKEATGNDALLRVLATVERIGERENDLWIRKLAVSGRWLGSKPLFFETTDGDFNDQHTQCVHQGNGCDDFAKAELVAKSVPALEVMKLRTIQEPPIYEFSHANQKKMHLQMGPINAKIRFGTAFKGGRAINHIDFRADGLSSVKESIGGELADDVSTVSFLSVDED